MRDDNKKYWSNILSSFSERVELPYDYIDKKVYKSETISDELDKEVYKKLDQVTKGNEILTYIIFLAAMDIQLFNYTGKEENFVGIPLYSSKKQEIKRNKNRVLPLNLKLHKDLQVKALLMELQKQIVDAYENQNIDIDAIVEDNKIANNIMEITPVTITMDSINKAEHISYICDSTKNEISICIKKDKVQGIKLECVYNSQLFKKETIQKFLTHYKQVMINMLNHINDIIKDVEIINEVEKHIILEQFNNTQRTYIKGITIQEAFEKQVEKTPDIPIAVYKGKRLTYKEFNEKANALAHVLREKGVGKDTLVGIMLDKSFHMLIGIIGILKAGGAYVPIDIKYPIDRVNYVLKDADIKLLLTDKKVCLDEVEQNVERLYLDDEQIYQNKIDNLNIINNEESLAYVIYTSGSTGQPKGVLIEHKGVINLCNWFNEVYDIKQNNNILQNTSISFDVSVEEIFGAILNGGTLYICTEDEYLNKDEFVKFINQNQINIVQLVPSTLQVLIADEPKLPSIKILTCGGEALSLALKNKVIKKGYRLYNCYGPTETTVDAVTGLCEDNDYVVIGKPISNTCIYVVNEYDQIVPIGMKGEMCISGIGLARGYLNRDELTKERFVDNPFNENAKMYRTGDIVRWLADGTIEYIGRKDAQVKVRGFRIELGEIENKLTSCTNVKEAAVVVHSFQDNEKYICAYLVGDVNVDEVKAQLQACLPEYMIPTYFTVLEKLPVFVNGKVNKKALEKPQVTSRRSGAYVAPKNSVEERLEQIWEDILDIKQIGVNDNFFECGGHSLKAIVLSNRIKKEFGVDLNLKEMFKISTIKQMSEYIQNGTQIQYSAIECCEKRPYYVTSPAQKRMYILQHYDHTSTAYNMPAIYKVIGNLQQEKIEYIFNELIKRHEILRTNFKTINQEIVQQVHEKLDFKLNYIEGKSIDDISREFIRYFDLENDCLFRAEIAKVDSQYYLLIDMHHIIGDAVSMEVLIKEFFKLYREELLEPINVAYKDFAKWQNDFLKSDELERQKKYWQDMYQDEIPTINLPYDYKRPIIQSFEGNSLSCVLGEELTEKLRSIGQKYDYTMQMMLLAAFYILLEKYTGQDDVIVGIPVAGRVHYDTQDMIGLFVNTLALRKKIDGDISCKAFIDEVRETCLNGYENQSYQFEDLIESINVNRDSSRNPLFDVVFNSSIQKEEASLTVEEFKLEELKVDKTITKFDLTLSTTEREKDIRINLEYCSKLFRQETAQQMLNHYCMIVEALCNQIDKSIAQIEMITEEEKREIIEVFNQTTVEYPRNQTIDELFEEVVCKQGDRNALYYKGKTLSYKELNEKANQLAHLLRRKGMETDIVGVMLERSIEAIISILAILKAGGAYLPIDVNYPKERINYMLKDAGCKYLLTSSSYIENIECEVECIDVTSDRLNQESKDNLEHLNKANSLAYVIYSSGSTGTPKGVLVEHRNIVRLVKNNSFVQYEAGDRILQTGSIAFDASTFEIWGSLLNGIELFMTDTEEIVVGEKLGAYLKQHHITTLWLTVALFNQLVEEDATIFSELKYLLVGGDALSPKHINLVRECCKNVKLINGYGPTENTTFSTTFLIDKKYERNIPIGKPICNSTAYIVGSNGQLQPKGVFGELYVGGDGVSRGYLNNPTLTAEKYIDSPFKKGERLYKTGDVARFLHDGNIEFMGRADNQIKIRGYRIELEEIEAHLVQYKEIKEAVVVVSENNLDKIICAYITAANEINVADIKAYLKTRIPDYMIPTVIKKIDYIPLTINGKVDKKALPKVNLEEIVGAQRVLPRNELEQAIAEIWKEILGLSQVGVTDDFFDLGGHSLKAIAITNSLEKRFNKHITLKDFFSNPTIETVAKIIENKACNKDIRKIEKVAQKTYYEVSAAQKRMYILQELDKSSTAYNMPFVFEAKEDLDLEKLEQAFSVLVKRHESLRTNFKSIDNQVYQIINSEKPFKIQVIEDDDYDIKSFVKPFELSKDQLLRIAYIKKQSKQYLVIDMHHIISDGMSMKILFNEFIKLYKGEVLGELSIQYKDFAYWQNQFLASEDLHKQETYWLEMFSDELPLINLPYDYERPKVQTFDGETISYKINETLTKSLMELSKEQGKTLYTILLAAFNVMLFKYSGQEDIIIGTPVLGRTNDELKNVIGMFVNTVVLRNKPQADKVFGEFLDELNANTLQAFEYQDYQFEQLIEKLNVPRQMDRNPLFDVMFSFNNNEMNREQEQDILKAYEIMSTVSKFDLSLYATYVGDYIKLSFEYNTRLFKRETVEAFMTHYIKVIEQICKNVQVKIHEIDMLTSEEKELLDTFNDTDALFRDNVTVQEIFEEQVKQHPMAPAVIFREETLSFEEINRRVNQLAHYLRELGVGPDKIVALVVERSAEMMVGILGILKAGGAYLPIDPNYPDERIQYILENSQAELLLTANDVLHMDFDNIRVIDLKDEKINHYSMENPKLINTSRDMAYIIYTSGTTGKPKGVMIEHRALINRLNWMQKAYPINSNDRILQKTTYTFDVSVWELIWWSLEGAQVVFLEPKQEKEPDKIVKAIEKYSITTMHFVPSMLNIFLEYVENMHIENQIGSLRQVFASGEALKPVHVNKFNHLLYHTNKTRLINLYGPTEATIDVTYFNCYSDEMIEVVPIGKPIDNIKLYVVDKYHKLLPIGGIGELCISGVGVARGYLNNKELTQKKFIQNPINTEEVMYKTGDLVRWRPDGNIQYLGRIDHQVKIRGFRIELEEIEKVIVKYPNVSDAIVLVKNNTNGDKYLCAYIVSSNEVDKLNLKEYLESILPDYMVPMHFITISTIPTTANGKLDRRALPEPSIDSLITQDYEEARNELDKQLIEIWKEVLGVVRIGIKDNFFDLGGYSLNAITLLGKIHKKLNTQISLQQFFKMPSIKQLSNHIAQSKVTIFTDIKQVDRALYYPASSAQKRIYMVQQLDKQNLAYNMPVVFKLVEDIDLNKIEIVINKLIQVHEGLRTYFEEVSGQIVQKIKDEITFKLEIKETKEHLTGAIKEFIRPFNLNEAPLFRIQIVKNNEGVFLLADMHHIISDAQSMQIMMEDLLRLYQGQSLEQPRIQYKDYSAWLVDIDKTLKQHEAYWLDKFQGEIPVLNLPYDYTRPKLQSFKGDKVKFKLNKDVVHTLRKIVSKYEVTTHMILVAAWDILLAKYTGQEDIIIGIPVSGRNHIGLQRVIGVFINMLPFRMQINNNSCFNEFLLEVKQNLVEAYTHGEYQFEELISNLNIERDMSRNPLFDVTFNMLNVKQSNYIKENMIIAETLDSESNIVKCDINLNVIDNEEELLFELDYCKDLFRKESIQQLVACYINIIKAICENDEIKLLEIEMLSQEMKECLINTFNNTDITYENELQPIHKMFEYRTLSIPNETAVIYQGRTISYKELDKRANGVANYLKEQGVQPGQVVGILLERRIEMIICILGILKTGAAYVPIDAKNPKDRIAYILEDAKIRYLLTTKALSNDMVYDGCCIDIENDKVFENNQTKVSFASNMHDLAYIIYTSGTTGKPKGVMVEHGSLMQTLNWASREYQYDRSSTILSVINYAFDGFIVAVFAPLISGSKIVFLDNEEMNNAYEMSRCINKYSVTDYISVPTIYAMVLEYLKKDSECSLKTVTLVGEEIPVKVIKKTKNFLKGVEIINRYGPSENTVDTAIMRNVEDDRQIIGKPIDNTKIFILDTDNKLVPIGVCGEICISGQRLAKGYINNEALTREKFIQNPYIPQMRMYKTGDLGRWLPDGTIEFMGRIDFQVKVRGIRIELKGIQDVLDHYELVKESVVIARTNEEGEKYICGYYVANQVSIDKNTLIAYLKEKLPEYMVPKCLMQIDEIPRSLNGKVDVRKLPEIKLEKETIYVAPRNEIEYQLVEIWEEVLGVNQVGIDDNFFDLGGSSLGLIKLLSKIKELFNENIDLNHIYRHATIREISILLEFGQEIAATEDISRYLLNQASELNIFAFPPIGGLGIVYSELAEQLKGVGLYAFDFIEDENNIEKYVKLITTIQPEGSYILMGYSAGGNLAYQVAAYLEKQGYSVAKLILIDSYITEIEQEEIINLDERSNFEEILENAIDHPVYGPYLEDKQIREKLIDRMEQYSKQLYHMEYKNILNAEIDLIKSIDLVEENKINQWKQVTSSQVVTYLGAGSHEQMIEGKELHDNILLINKILNI